MLTTDDLVRIRALYDAAPLHPEFDLMLNNDCFELYSCGAIQPLRAALLSLLDEVVRLRAADVHEERTDG